MVKSCAIGGDVLALVDVISDSGDCAIVTASSRHGVISENCGNWNCVFLSVTLVA